MLQWASFTGLAMTGIGVLIAFYMPTVGAYFGGGPAVDRRQLLLRLRSVTGAGLVIAGTLLQMYSAWPR